MKFANLTLLSVLKKESHYLRVLAPFRYKAYLL